MLASAFIQDVPIILLDEPFTFLDPQALSHLKNILLTLHERGKTLITVSHHLETLFPIVTHIAALKEGNLVYSGEKRFNKKLLRETYGVNFSHLAFKNREVIFIDE
jgi:ABC-type cobalamin/Fe3+-siderophores transport system ATPase subunit